MKRCPECRRDYYDDSLSFCLADGAELVYGLADDEPATAILHDTATPGEAATRARIHTIDAETGPDSSKVLEKQGFSANTIKPLIGLGIVILLLVGGFFAYRYFSRTAAGQIDSIAVMPFVNDGQNPDLEYLSDGMTETLMNSLSQLPGLSVKARSSVFRYKGKETDAQTIGKELGVQALLNGRLVKRGDDLTLFLELVDTYTGNRTWGEQYTEPIANLITLQNHIARDVSQKLSIKLSGADQKKLGKNYTENAEAYQLYLQGRYFWNKRTAQGFRTAIPYFERALAIDENYALAHTGLADSFALMTVYEGALPRDAMPKAKEQALIALSLDPDLAEAHASLGQIVHNYEYNFAEAEREYKRAIELNPNYASVYQWYAELLTNVGRFNEAAAAIDRALELDPLSLIINRMKGYTLVYSGRREEGLEHMKKTVALDPSYPGVNYDISVVNQLKGNYSDAVTYFVKWRELSGDSDGARRAREAFAKDGWRGFLLAMTKSDSDYRSFQPYHMVVFYTALDDKESAINELMNAYNERDNDIIWIKVDPRLEPLRDDPRFQELLTKVGFPD